MENKQIPMTERRVKLSKKYNDADGKDTDILEIGEIKGGDLIDCGMPFSFNKDEQYRIDTKVALALLGRVSNFTEANFRSFTSADMIASCNAVVFLSTAG